METIIRTNGSKFAGDPPDSLESLIDVLEGREHRFAPNAERWFVLDRSFEEYGSFIRREGTMTHFWGNFLDLSHAFDIRSDDPDVIARLTAAIAINRARPEYLAQPDPAIRRANEKHTRLVNERLKHAFEHDGEWLITRKGWAGVPKDYRDTEHQRMLVNGGGRGTMLVHVTIIDDDDPRIAQNETSAPST
jgi:hypothetical protein